MFIFTEQAKVGRFNVNVVSDDSHVGMILKRGFEWDGWMRKDVEILFRPGTDILDIGGNIGWNALMFSDYGPVHSFEPLFHPIISRNVLQNELKHPVKVYPYGLSDKEESIKLYHTNKTDSGTNYGGFSMHPEEVHSQDFSVVQVKRLDDVYFGTPSLVKIDVEGHEISVLRGAEKIIRACLPSLLIEIWDSKSPVFDYVKSFGYTHVIQRPEHMFLFVRIAG
jgi:FkbM family methyltransferase